MKINVIKSGLPCFSAILFLAFMIGCEKKFQRPDHYKIDLFEDQRQEGKAYVMTQEEAFDASEMVIASSDIKLIDSYSGRGKSIFIYKVNTGKLLKTTRDSVVKYPFNFLSNQKLKLREDSMYIYLQKLNGYRFIAEEKNLRYQWLKAAPVYPVKKESK